MNENRIEIMHGVNFDVLEVRDASVYGGLTLMELEVRVKGFAQDLGLEVNPGAWTHYSYAIRDAIELTALPAVEVHLSEIDSREDWRRHSVIRDVCIGNVQGKGVDGYREALEMLKGAFES